MNQLLLGLAAGAVATVPMTMVMELLRERLPGEPSVPLPPRQVTSSVANMSGIGRHLEEKQHQQLTLAAHFGYGAAAGALLAPVAAAVPIPPAATGIAFGLGVWAASYLGWLPAAGIGTMPARIRRRGAV